MITFFDNSNKIRRLKAVFLWLLLPFLAGVWIGHGGLFWPVVTVPAQIEVNPLERSERVSSVVPLVSKVESVKQYDSVHALRVLGVPNINREQWLLEIGRMSYLEGQFVLGQLAKQDPELALSLAEKAYGAFAQRDARREIFSTIGQGGRSSVYRGTSMARGRDDLLAMYKGWASADFNDFVGSFEELPDADRFLPEIKEYALTEYVRRHGIASVGDWISGLEGEGTKLEMASIAIDKLYAEDPESALRWLSAYGNESYAVDAAEKLAGELAAQDPRRAAEIALALENPDVQTWMLVRVGEVWARADPQAASDWMLEMPMADRAYEMVRINAARAIVQDRPELAVAWGMSIGDEDRRSRIIYELFQELQRNDPSLVHRYLGEGGIPEDVRLLYADK